MVADMDNHGGDGILWYIDKNATNLASGVFADGGSQDFGSGTGGAGLSNITISQGDFLYFAIHPRGSYPFDTTRLDILISATNLYSISGRVTDADGNVISGVTISAGAAGSATTDSNGNYTISGLTAGTYTLTPSKSGYSFTPARRTVSVSSNVTGQDFVGTILTYSISGQVTDGNGNPISSATISDGAGHTNATDGSGHYTLNGLMAGTYTLTPSKSGYSFAPASRTVTVPPDATGQDFAGQASIRAPLRLTSLYPPAGQVSPVMQGGIVHRYFEVRDAAGNLAANVTVTFTPVGGGTSNGTGLLDVAANADALGGPGSHTLTLANASWNGQSLPVGGPVSFVVQLDQRPVTHFWEGGTIRKVKGGKAGAWSRSWRASSRAAWAGR